MWTTEREGREEEGKKKGRQTETADDQSLEFRPS